MATRIPSLMLGAAALLACAGTMAASAQDYSSDEQITVTAPRLQPQDTETQGGRLVATRATVSLPVSYAGLNLSSGSDRRELRIRINDTARDACRELDRQYSPLVYAGESSLDCVNHAARDAMAQVDELVADKAG
jgi:UrcA family protein